MCVGLFSIDIKSMYVLAYFLLSHYSLVNVLMSCRCILSWRVLCASIYKNKKSKQLLLRVGVHVILVSYIVHCPYAHTYYLLSTKIVSQLAVSVLM